MSDFSLAIPVILAHEGGSAYTNKITDKGGPTRWGITARTLGAWRNLGRPATPEEVQALGEDEACAIYRARYWDVCRCGELDDQTVATKVFDIAVNCGTFVASRLLQRAVNLCQSDYVPEDGRIGPVTLAAANACAPDDLITYLVRVQEDHYRLIVASNSSQEPNLRGWLIRAQWPLRSAA